MTPNPKKLSNALREMGADMLRVPSLKRTGRYVLLALCVAVGCEKESPFVEVTPELLRAVRASAPPTEPGQSATLLSSGDWLLLGGEQSGRPVATAKLLGNGRELPIGDMRYARSGHTATVLPDGSVLVLGGVGPDGRVVTTAESFNVSTQQFAQLEGLESLARAQHTATLLSDG